jgi:myo-inositol 2-dehydrogenase / D-chiro-inositol 1-dehydrogenase
MSRVRLGLAGVGELGSFHAQNLTRRVALADLVRVVDQSEEAARATGNRLGVDWSTSYGDILDDDSIRGVVIASSTSTHSGLIQEAAAAGKHVFTEKPIALELQATVDAIEAARSAGVKLQVGFHRRFDPDFEEVARRVHAGDVGDIYFLRLAHRDMTPPIPGTYLANMGHLFVDATIHDFDTVLWLGGGVKEVAAYGASVVDPQFAKTGDADHAVVIVRLAAGGLCVIDNSRSAGYGYECALELIGSSAAARISNGRQGQLEWLSTGETRAALPSDHTTRHPLAYVRELDAFVRTIRDDAPSPVPSERGLEAFQLTQLALHSLREGRPMSADGLIRSGDATGEPARDVPSAHPA